MPLSRYEIRSEYSLANPDLYRAADKDDPEGLLEGVAMAGLVGIIRQLGDLAEFAAEVFHDLHEDVLAIAARGHELFERIRHLETEVPLIEKMMLSRNDNGNCFYNPGLEWHVHIHNDQNHFTQGDLPRFIRSAYEDCRSPPRLFTLDRYDVAGAGSCLKRVTDPSFFRMEWASSELMKAEKEQREQKARRMKRKGERQAQGEVREAKIASHIQFRMPSEVENTETLRSPSSASDSSLDSLMQRAVDSLENNDVRLASGLLVSEQKGLQSKNLVVEDFRVKELPSSSLDMKMEHSTLDTASHVDVSVLEHSSLDTASHMDVGVLKNSKNDVGTGEVAADDSASETDNFMDAVTTIDSEVETDSEMKTRAEVDGEFLVELEEVEAPAPAFELQTRADDGHDEVDGELLVELEEVEAPAPASFELRRGADDEDNVTKEDKECSIIEEDKECLVIEDDKGGLVLEEDIACEEDKEGLVIKEDKEGLVIKEDKEGLAIEEDIASEESSDTEHAYFVANSPKVFAEEEDCSFVDGISAVATSVQDNDASTPNIGCGTSFLGLGDDTVTKSEGYVIDNTPAEEEDLSFVDKSDVVLCVKDNVAASISRSNASSPGLEEDAVLDAEGHHTSLVLETLEALEADNIESFLEENVSADFNHGPVDDLPVDDLPPSKSPKDLGAVTMRKRWQISNLFSKEILASDLERDSLQASEDEKSESPTKLSLQSSPSSTIQPMKWAVDLARSYHTDDDMEGMQISSASPSTSSSTLSSPRPSTLATTLLNMSLERKPQKSHSSSSCLQHPGVGGPGRGTESTANAAPPSVDSSPQSRSSKSGIKTAPYQSTSQVKTSSEPLMSPEFEDSAHSSPHSSSSAEQPFFDPLPSLALNGNISSTESPPARSLAATNLEIFPPPPPLPPLAWRTTRRTHNTVVNPSKPMESPTSIPIPCDVRVLPDELSQAFTSSTTLPNVPYASTVELNEPAHAFSSPTIGKPTSQKMLDESMQSSTYETGLSDLETLHGRSDNLPQVSKSAKSHDRGPPLASFTPNADTVEQGTASVLATSDIKGESIATAGSGSSLQDEFIHDSTCVISPRILRTGSNTARLDESRLGLQTKAAVEYGSSASVPQRNDLPSVLAPNFERKDSTEATTSHDMSKLKKRSTWALTSSTASSDDREVLLDQIRTRSFSLRNTSREKPAPPRPVTNINVAAILEKANAIRQAFAGSDDDDDEEWSDA